MTESLPDLAALLPSWELALNAERKSPATVEAYTIGVRMFLRWCADTGTTPELTKATVQGYTTALLNSGAEAATARARHMTLRRFAAWLVDEGELDTNPLLNLKPPQLDKKVNEALTDDELKRFIAACRGKDMIDRRDEAIARLMAETGVRASELLNMATDDVDLRRGLATVRRGKGGKGRVVPFGPQTAAAVDRYMRARRAHRLADTGPLWLGAGGQTFGYHGLNMALKRRAQAAGIDNFHLHLMRSTAATRWLRAGGSEQGLMSVAGWSTRSMIDCYTGAWRRSAPQPRRGRSTSVSCRTHGTTSYHFPGCTVQLGCTYPCWTDSSAGSRRESDTAAGLFLQKWRGPTYEESPAGLTDGAASTR